MEFNYRVVMPLCFYKEMELREVIQRTNLWQDFQLLIQQRDCLKFYVQELFLVLTLLLWLPEMLLKLLDLPLTN